MRRIIFVCLVVVGMYAASAHAVSYSGSLSGDGGGLIANEDWNSSSTVLEWTVSASSPNPTLWHYQYTLTVPAKTISHIIIETSPEFKAANLFDLTSIPESWAIDPEIKKHNEGEGNPGLPEDMDGLKVNAGVDVLMVTLSFDSDRVPVWGDFYAKDGNGGTINMHNAGFTSPDWDPDIDTYPLQNGSVEDHLLVPDSLVPEPATLLLLGLGGLA